MSGTSLNVIIHGYPERRQLISGTNQDPGCSLEKVSDINTNFQRLPVLISEFYLTNAFLQSHRTTNCSPVRGTYSICRFTSTTVRTVVRHRPFIPRSSASRISLVSLDENKRDKVSPKELNEQGIPLAARQTSHSSVHSCNQFHCSYFAIIYFIEILQHGRPKEGADY